MRAEPWNRDRTPETVQPFYRCLAPGFLRQIFKIRLSEIQHLFKIDFNRPESSFYLPCANHRSSIRLIKVSEWPKINSRWFWLCFLRCNTAWHVNKMVTFCLVWKPSVKSYCYHNISWYNIIHHNISLCLELCLNERFIQTMAQYLSIIALRLRWGSSRPDRFGSLSWK
jgi:hypothetical protein